jgi:hypothetical protein
MQKTKPCTIALLALSQRVVNAVSATNAINAKCNGLNIAALFLSGLQIQVLSSCYLMMK